MPEVLWPELLLFFFHHISLITVISVLSSNFTLYCTFIGHVSLLCVKHLLTHNYMVCFQFSKNSFLVNMGYYWRGFSYVLLILAVTAISHTASASDIACNKAYLLRCNKQQQQSLYGPLSGTTWVSRYQKKHSPTHHPDHHPAYSIYYDP